MHFRDIFFVILIQITKNNEGGTDWIPPEAHRVNILKVSEYNIMCLLILHHGVCSYQYFSFLLMFNYLEAGRSSWGLHRGRKLEIHCYPYYEYSHFITNLEGKRSFRIIYFFWKYVWEDNTIFISLIH